VKRICKGGEEGGFDEKLFSRLTFLVSISIYFSKYAKQFQALFVVSCRNYLASTLDYMVMHMRKVDRTAYAKRAVLSQISAEK